jgi:predicted DCC family thiol-disulfide oxidoreductase YuxK
MASTSSNVETATQSSNHQLRFEDLPYAPELPEHDPVIFDGDCRFCLQQVRRLKKLDAGGARLAFVSLHDPYVLKKFPDLTYEQMMQQLYVVDRQGNRHGGAAALRYLSRRLPWLWPAAPFLHIPFSLPLWQAIYRWIAKRRYRLAGKTNDDCQGSCSLHFHDQRK